MPDLLLTCPNCNIPLRLQTPLGTAQKIRCPKCSQAFSSAPTKAEDLPPVRTDPGQARTVDFAAAPSAPPSRNPSHGPLAGVEIPGYELLGLLGRGGMGAVFKARQLQLNRIVALKTMLGGLHTSQDEVARLRNEAEVIARFQHPNIVQIFDVGEAEGHLFLALEYVEGGTLSDHLKGAPEPADQAASLVETLARAMDYAHRQGVVHRDLKPANILMKLPGAESGARSTLSPDTKPLIASGPSTASMFSNFGHDVDQTDSAIAPVPKITDFGLAKDVGGQSGQTQTGAFMGTPSYAAPEQALGNSRHVTAAADIYALGAILYELLTGRPPFRGASVLDTLDQVRNVEPVSLRLLNPAAPKDLETICLKCLRKKPADRYASALDLAEDLRRFRSHEPIKARPVGSMEKTVKWIARNPAVASILSLLVLVLVVGVTAVTLESSRARRAEGNALIAADNAKKEKERADKKRDEAVSLAGKLEIESKALEEKSVALEEKTDRLVRALATTQINLAENSWGKGNVALANRQLDAIPETHRFWDWRYLKRRFRGGLFSMHGHAGTVTCMAISPDGRRLLTGGADKTVRLWDSATGQELAQFSEFKRRIKSVAFHPSGRMFAAVADTSLVIWDAKVPKRLHSIVASKAQVNAVAFHPDGQRLATGSDDHTVVLWDVATGKRLSQIGLADPRINARPREVHHLAFSPDGARIAIDHYFDGVEVWDTEMATKHFALPKTGGLVVWTPDGKHIIAAGGFGKIFLFNKTGELIHTYLPTNHPDVTAIAPSPDGLRFATASTDNMISIWGVVSGKELLQLQGHTTVPYTLCFSTDSQRLFSGDSSGVIKIWDSIANRTAQAFNTPAPNPNALAFSPNSNWLAVGGVDSLPAPCGIVDIWDLATGVQLRSLNAHAQNIAGVTFSKDGKKLITASRGSPLGRVESEVKVWDTQTWKELWTLPHRPGSVWVFDPSPDNRYLALSYANDVRRLLTGPGTIRVWDLDRKEEILTIQATRNAAHEIRFSPDGQFLAAAMDQAIFVWDMPSGEVKARFPSGFGEAMGLAFSSDSKKLTACGTIKGVGVIRIYDIADNKLLQTIAGDTNQITSLAFSPDGERLATGSREGTRGGIIRLWDLRNGQQVLEFDAHPRSVQKLVFDSTGRYLASSGDGDGQAKIWEAPFSDDPAALQKRLNTDPMAEPQTIARRRLLAKLDTPLHLRMVLEREKTDRGFAAAYHLVQLLDAKPANLDFHRRRVKALASFNALEINADGLRKLLDHYRYDASLYCSVGLVQRDLKLTDDALKSLKHGHELGSRLEHWTYPSAQWIQECEQK